MLRIKHTPLCLCAPITELSIPFKESFVRFDSENNRDLPQLYLTCSGYSGSFKKEECDRKANQLILAVDVNSLVRIASLWLNMG